MASSASRNREHLEATLGHLRAALIAAEDTGRRGDAQAIKGLLDRCRDELTAAVEPDSPRAEKR